MRSGKPASRSSALLDDIVDDLDLTGISDAAEVRRRAFLAGLEPPPKLSVSEWAEEYRILPDDAPEPGPYRCDRAPMLREIMDALSTHSPHERCVLRKGTQIGASEVGNNLLGYLIQHAPQTVLYVMQSDAAAKKASKTRIEPMIRDSAALARLVTGEDDESGSLRKRRRGTILEKFWPGGRLMMVSAKSIGSLKSDSAQNLFFDELDEAPLDIARQGDALALAIKRLDAFKGRSKVYLASTPTMDGQSKICEEYEKTDQRVAEFPCPHCGHWQQITFFGHIRWPKEPEERPEEAYFVCEACGGTVEEGHQKEQMISRGRWRPTAVGLPGRIGWHYPALLSLFFTWGACARQFVEAKGNPFLMKVFTNTVLAEPFRDEVTTVSEDQLLDRLEPYPADVPRGVLAITCGVDTQDDRFELEVVGWGDGFESWGLAYRKVWGVPDKPETRAMLQQEIDRIYQHVDGYGVPIACTFIDSRGHYTQEVYRFCEGKEGRRIFAIAGVPDNGKRPLVSSPHKKQTGQGRRHNVLYDVCTGIARGHVYGRLNVKEPGPGYCHWPADGRGYDEEYFRQLTSMEVRDRPMRGRIVREWMLKKGRRKEALDCRCYALAALYMLNVDWSGLRRTRENQAAKVTAPAATGQKAPAAAPEERHPTRPARRPRRSGWVNRW